MHKIAIQQGKNMKLLQKMYTLVGIVSLLCGEIILPNAFLSRWPLKLGSPKSFLSRWLSSKGLIFSKKKNGDTDSMRKTSKFQRNNKQFRSLANHFRSVAQGENLSNDTRYECKKLIKQQKTALKNTSNLLSSMHFRAKRREKDIELCKELQSSMKKLYTCLDKLSKNYSEDMVNFNLASNFNQKSDSDKEID